MHLLISLLICFTFQSEKPRVNSDIKLHEHLFLDNQLSIFIPDGFNQMNEEMLKFKYPSERRPTIVYTNSSGSVNVAINHTLHNVSPAQLAEFKEYLTSVFKNLHPTATWYRNEIVERGKQKLFLLDLQTPAIDTDIRNIILATSLQGRLLLISFNCTKKLEDKWLPIGNQIIESLQVKDK